jgi:SAM-dependent methyltransferase
MNSTRQAENYETELWPLIYDKYNSHGREKLETEYYYNYVGKKGASVLEPACGTGLIMLEMLRRGIDICGFDISLKMLDHLKKKAYREKLDIRGRVFKKNLNNFNLNRKFDYIYITARSFLHLLTQKEQINSLKRIHSHLKPGGKFLMNIYTPDFEILYKHSLPDQKFSYYDSYILENGKEVHLYSKQEHDLSNQIQNITWRFVVDNKKMDSKMQVRWIYPSEFKLLLRISGFRKWELYGGFKGETYRYGREMLWIVTR